jgi:hypothetical protein
MYNIMYDIAKAEESAYFTTVRTGAGKTVKNITDDPIRRITNHDNILIIIIIWRDRIIVFGASQPSRTVYAIRIILMISPSNNNYIIDVHDLDFLLIIIGVFAKDVI